MMFDSAPESIENQFRGLVFEIICFLDFLRGLELSKIFIQVVFPLVFGRCDLYWNILQI